MTESRRLLQSLCFAAVLATMILAAPASAQPTVAGSAVDVELRWRLEHRWTVGGSDDEDLVLSTFWAKDLATDARGRLFVVDRTEHRIVIYDRDGRRVTTLGAKGMGPGELSGPVWVEAGPDGTAHVFDVEKEAVVVFGADAKALPEYRLTTRLRAMRLLTDGSRIGEVQRRDTVRLVRLVGGSSRELAAHPVAPTRSTPPVCRVTDYPAPPVFAATLVWGARDRRIVSATDGFAITVFEDGTPQRVLTRATPRRRATEALAKRHLGRGPTLQIMGMPPCTIPAELILSVAEVAKELPAYARLVIAPDQRIWAVRFAVRGEPHVVDVYDPVRGYVGTVNTGIAEPVAFLSTGDLVSLETDPDDVPRISVYRVHAR